MVWSYSTAEQPLPKARRSSFRSFHAPTMNPGQKRNPGLSGPARTPCARPAARRVHEAILCRIKKGRWATGMFHSPMFLRLESAEEK